MFLHAHLRSVLWDPICGISPYHMHFGVSQGCTFTLIPNCMGSYHGQRLMETETDSYISWLEIYQGSKWLSSQKSEKRIMVRGMMEGMHMFVKCTLNNTFFGFRGRKWCIPVSFWVTSSLPQPFQKNILRLTLISRMVLEVWKKSNIRFEAWKFLSAYTSLEVFQKLDKRAFGWLHPYPNPLKKFILRLTLISRMVLEVWKKFNIRFKAWKFWSAYTPLEVFQKLDRELENSVWSTVCKKKRKLMTRKVQNITSC